MKSAAGVQSWHVGDPPTPAAWTCPHGTTYTGTPDFVGGVRNAHDEIAG